MSKYDIVNREETLNLYLCLLKTKDAYDIISENVCSVECIEIVGVWVVFDKKEILNSSNRDESLQLTDDDCCWI